MTDQQLFTLALAIIIPLSLLLYSNSRITDAKEALRAEIGEAKQTLRLEIADLRREMSEGFSKIETLILKLDHKLEIHELEHHSK